MNSREHGQLQARDVEIALGRLAPSRSAAPGKTVAQLQAQMAAAFASDRSVPSALREAHDRGRAIQALIGDRVGATRALDLAPLLQPLACLLETCETALGTRRVARTVPPRVSRCRVGRSGPGELRSRHDAVQMLEMVCRYMEQHEPSNPAPLFIRRAQRLIKMNFVEIVKDLMPDSLAQLEKLAGEFEKYDVRRNDMPRASSQKFIARNRAPRVQIEYDVELYGAEKKIQLPFVMGVMANLSGNPPSRCPMSRTESSSTSTSTTSTSGSRP